jgi:Ser/Thr protein kinase RdoA (MazF antagonist)
LTVIHPRRPELVPAPLSCTLDSGVDGAAPSVTMSLLPGRPLGTDGPVSARCLDAVAAAITTLHQVLPRGELDARPVRRWDPATAMAEVLAWADAESSDRASGELGAEVRAALDAGTAWIRTTPVPERIEHPVFARADGNAANLLWDGEQIRIVDFEDAGTSDLTFEVADTVEHLSVWLDAGIDADDLVARFDLARSGRARLTEYRRLFGLFWLLMLLPDNPAAARNAPGTANAQAERLLALLDTVA